jgi:large subunit ribosomal protein L4
MKITLKNTKGKVVGSVQVRDDVFGVPPNPAVVHQVLVGQLANARQGTVSVKSRSGVSGGGRKPRPQKHTGQSRAGTIRASQWRGGGAAFGPQPRSYRQRTTKRMRRLSLVTVLSDKVREDDLVVLENLDLEQARTKEMVGVLDAVGAGPAPLLVADGAGDGVFRAARNIPRLRMLPAALLNTADLLKPGKVVMTQEALRKAEALWGRPLVRRPRPGVAADAAGSDE